MIILATHILISVKGETKVWVVFEPAHLYF